MSRIDNERFYTAAINKHGITPKGVHWNSRHSQETRFEVLLSCVDLSGATVVDAGCGFADLYGYLQKRSIGVASYVGLDVSEQMVKIAKAQSGCTILQRDICRDDLPEADYYVCSGAMNILSRFDTFLFIRNCYMAARKAFVFNLLMGEDDSLVYNHFFPEELQGLFEELGARVQIKTGYLSHDFTVCLSKEEG